MAAERDAIVDHLVRDWGFDAAWVAAALPVLKADFDAAAIEQSARAMARFTAANPDCNGAEIERELLDFLRDLMAADGRIDPREVAAIARIEAAFGDERRWSLDRLAESARGALATAGDAAGEAADAARDMPAATGSAAGKAAGVAGEALGTAGARTVELATAARDRQGKLMRRSDA